MKLLATLMKGAVAAACLCLPSGIQAKPANVLDLKYSIEDSNIVYPESFETASQQLLERWYLRNYTSFDNKETSKNDPGASDKEIRERLSQLPTVIDMPFNPIVKQYIERFTKRGRKQVAALLGLSQYYMPIFEQALEEASLPLELKYLPVIESGLNPTATSKHGAAGLWQFIISTARGYDMEVSSLVDERRDPYISSERACRMLKHLYDTYGDWSLAIAAYNCGPGTVNKALNRAGGTPDTHDFWSIYYYLPEETRGYVPMFIAANYVMNYYPEHGIAPVLATKPLITDTIHLHDRVHFNQISAVLDIPVDELRLLNPQFRADIIPASVDHPYNLILPSQQIHAYIVSEDQILAYDRDKYARRIEATPGGDPNAIPEEDDLGPVNPADPAPVEAAAAELAYEETHPVAASAEEATQAATPRRRRTEGALADSSPIQNAKSAAKEQTQPKKTETEPKKPAAAEKKKETANNSSAGNNKKKQDQKKQDQKKQTSGKAQSHTVESGQNLSVIAKRYGVSVEQLKKANPKINPDKIHPGDKISIPAKSTGKKGKK